MIGIAFTGTGKSLVYIIPLIMLALEEESKIPIVSGEGPFGLLMMPSVTIEPCHQIDDHNSMSSQSRHSRRSNLSAKS